MEKDNPNVYFTDAFVDVLMTDRRDSVDVRLTPLGAKFKKTRGEHPHNLQ